MKGQEGQTMKLGIYGGTFNPPHLGHVTSARLALEALGLKLSNRITIADF